MEFLKSPGSNAGVRLGQHRHEYLPALDGFRAISIALVVISHAKMGLERIVPGGLGVLVFFVISGFLLTRQMVAEIEETGTLNLRRFYLRRFFRLMPALFVYIAISWCILSALGFGMSPLHALSGLLYFSNYYNIFVSYPPYNPMPITWSLSVEEHYYLVFPLVMLLFRRDLRSLAPWLLVAVGLALVWRVWLFRHCVVGHAMTLCGLPGTVRLDATDTIFDCILYGAITSLCLSFYESSWKQWLLGDFALFVALSLLAGSLLYRNPMFRDTLRFTVQSISVAIIIVNVLFGGGLSHHLRMALSCKPCLLGGRISYSLYLFHFLVLNLIYIKNGVNAFHGIGDFAVYLAASCLFAYASYIYIEVPMKRWRRRFGSHTVAPMSPGN